MKKLIVFSCLTVLTSLTAQEKPQTLGSIPVLTRQAYGTPDSQLALLRDSVEVTRSGAYSPERLKDRLRVTGSSWQMDVLGDGSAAEFLDMAASGRSHAGGVDLAQSMSTATLESTARTFVERNLSRVIIMQPGERLVLAATSRRSEGGVAPDGGKAYSAVVANRAIFSREINGIPVTGAGSKVTITFLNDGSIESFRYDWPKYVSTGRVQRMAQPAEILRRLQRVAGVRTKRDLYQPVQAPSAIDSITRPIALGSNVQLQDLKCGYYDPGLMNRAADAPVQAGCYYHMLDTRGEGDLVTTAGYSGAVPAATAPERDTRWPEANVILKVKGEKVPKPKKAGSGKKIHLVPPRPTVSN
ncbi:MAG: hypothetical protein M3Y27_03660 [Acidobacteriota bacterium]|nr:hypothetical protein [Acidobacteriota bacterium]